MSRTMFLALSLSVLMLAGCVSASTHKETLAELEGAQKMSADQAAALEAMKQQAAEEKARLTDELQNLQREQTRTSNELLAAQTTAGQAQAELSKTKKQLDADQQRLLEVERKLNQIQEENAKIDRMSGELRRERDTLQTKAEDLQRRLETTEQELAGRKQAVTDAEGRIAALEKEKADVVATLAETRTQARDLETRLDAEQKKVAMLMQEKQQLMSGTTTAQEEIGRLQKRAGELETVAARVKDLEKQLSERDQEIGTLRQAVADRQTLASKLGTQMLELDAAKERITKLTGELAAVGEEAALARQERDLLKTQIGKKQELLEAKGASLDRMETMLREEEARRKRVEEEKAAKEAEIARLNQTREDLAKSLQAEIAKGDIRIQQVRDRLTINMVDRVLFDSGKAEVKPAGLNVLKQVSDVLVKIKDKQIRIEGHTDNVPISARLREQFPTNWELSTARATSVIRYLVEKGGVDPHNLTAVGYADTRPISSNDSDEGRSANRRIEIVLFPKDIQDIAAQIQP